MIFTFIFIISYMNIFHLHTNKLDILTQIIYIVILNNSKCNKNDKQNKTPFSESLMLLITN